MFSLIAAKIENPINIIYSFFIRTSNILPSFNVLSSIWASSVLILVLFHSCSNKLQFVYLPTTSHLPCWKSRKFPILKGKKSLKYFSKYKSVVYNKLLIDSKRFLWYIFLFLTEHNPSFTLFLICSYFFTQSELRCSYKVCSYKKRVYDNPFLLKG